jgi:succinate dehydrogenase/fumarate reductase flavoprotein subunit
MTPSHQQQTRQIDCDLLVIGSGASGLAAAVTAWHGLKVVVVEKRTLAARRRGRAVGRGCRVIRWPGARGSLRIPAARTYLKNELGVHYNAERVDAFLDNAPHMVAFFERLPR